MSKISFYEIFSYLWKFTFVLIIPVLESFLSFFSGQSEIINLITYNSILVVVLFLWAYLEYKCKRYKVENNVLYVRKGFLLKQEQNFDLEKVPIVRLKSSLANKIFKVCKLSFFLKNNEKKKANSVFVVKKDEAKSIFEKVLFKKDLEEIYKPKITRTLLVAFLRSNPVTGLLFFLPLIDRTRNILDETLKNKIYSDMDFLINYVQQGIDSTATGVIRVFLVGWIIAFFIHFLSFLKQKTFKNNKNIFVEQGLVNKIKTTIDTKEIDFFMLKQTLFMSFLNIYNVYVNVLGDAKKESVLIAVGLKKCEVEKIFDDFIFEEKKSEILKTKIGIISRIWIPSLLFFVFAVLFIISKNDVMFLVTGFSMFYLVKWIVFEIRAIKRSEISIGNKMVKIKNNKAFNMLYIIAIRDKIKKIDMFENKKNKTCSFVFFMSSKKYFKISNINETRESMKSYLKLEM